MMPIIASGWGMGILLVLFVLGALGALGARKRDALASGWTSFWAIVGSAWGLVLAGSVLVSGQAIVVKQAVSGLPLLSLTLRVDRLSAFFMLVICLVALFCSIYALGYVRDFYQRYSLGALGFFYNLFIAAMLLVVSASNGILFLIAWELMALASYFLVVYDRRDSGNVKAGYTYLVMTHIGTAFIVIALMLLYGYTRSFDFETIRMAAGHIPQLVKDAVFLLALIGFGTKAGVIPLHIWLPSAHPAAPSHVSALMSGVMIKTGIYMMIRIFVGMLSPVPTWWGVVLLIVGSVSCVLGVLYALAENDIKRLLAYSSIENIGIILLGLGGALVFSALHLPALMLLSLAATLFHILNHAVFKSLLFLGAGSVIHATHTRNIEKYGGLIKLMPATAIFFLVGSMAISALPPLNGFFSEWMMFQSLFHGALATDLYIKWAFLIAAGALALAGGLALACFVKAFGTVFLARPRSGAARGTHESSWWMRSGMAGLATVCVALGVLSASVAGVLQSVGREAAHLSHAGSLTTVSGPLTLSVGQGYAAVSAPVLVAALLGLPVLVWLLVNRGISRKQKVRAGSTWDCGTEFTERMEITSTGFARSIVMIFRGLLGPSLRHVVEYDAVGGRYSPRSRVVSMSVSDIYRKYLYGPLNVLVLRVSRRAKGVQNGNINAYVLYILVTLVVILLVGV